MIHVSVAKARQDFADLLNMTIYGKERVIISRRGKQVAAVVPIADLRRYEELEEAEDLRAAQEALAEAEEKGFISLEEAKRQLGL